MGTFLVADADPRLDVIEDLGLAGSMLTALRHAEELGDPEGLCGSRARCMVAWLWDHLGGAQRARRWQLSEHRRAPQQASAKYFYAYAVLRNRGPVEAWLALRNYTPPSSTHPRERVEIASLKARLLASLGDDQQAEAWLEQCEPDILGLPRYASTRASLLEHRQRRVEAREVIEQALSAHPYHRLLVQHLATLLQSESRAEEALVLLAEADARLETPALASQRAVLEHDAEDFAAELRSLERYEKLSVKADREQLRELATRRAENAYRRGDFEAARRHCAEADPEYAKWQMPQLPEQNGSPDRKQLALPVLIQEPMGCAPASLGIISSYFGEPVDHVDVADEICYEGTASHSERTWVEQRGWLSHEFTVDFATAQALIERGVPFLLVTVDIASAHAQVVVGFDRTRNTLLTRDPMSPRVRELHADKLFERHRAYGPRGHVLLPPSAAFRLSGLELAETALHDAAHALRVALDAQDAPGTRACLAKLESLGHDHPLTLWARRMLAGRDGDPYAIRDCSEALLRRFPDDANADISVLECLASIGTTAEQEQRLRKRLAAPQAPWVYHERLARLLSEDAERLSDARRSLRRALREVPLRGGTLLLQARLEQLAGNAELSLCLSRVAATLEPTNDGLARNYFEAAFHQGHGETALPFLRDRVERYRERSSEPLCVLFSALEWLDREREAFSLLEEGLRSRPDDGELLLFAAEAQARYQHAAEATASLERAKGKVDTARWQESAARLAELAGDLHAALARHEAVLAARPLTLRSHEAVALLESELYGFGRARERLAQVCARYPEHCGLRELYIGWLRGHDPALVLPELERLLSLQPAHAWARRERALVLSELGRHADAVAEARAVAAQDRSHSASHSVLAAVLTAAGQRAEARGPAERAIELWPDGSGSIANLMRLAGSLDEQLALLRKVWQVVRDKSVSGEGVLAWRAYADGLLSQAELRLLADDLLRRRPSLWASHQLLASELLNAGEVDEACRLLREAAARFITAPRLLLTLASAERARGDAQAEAAALEAALRTNPAWITSVVRASEGLLQRKEPALAQRTLERGLHFHPRSSTLLLALSRLAFDRGEPVVALDHARSAVECDPESGEAWQVYAQRARHLERLEDVAELAEQLTRQRPWNAMIWLRLAEVRHLESENQASIEALQRALERRPDLFEALDTYAEALTRIGRPQEALAVCERSLANYFEQGALRARRAWVLWQFERREQALAAMRSVLEHHPDQTWGLQELVTWEQELEHTREAVELAQRLVERAPLRAVSHGFLGDALLASSDEQGAWQAFSKAARLDPAYSFAGSQRIRIALNGRRFEDARRVIAEQGEHVSPATRDYWELTVACREQDVGEALASLARLAKRPNTSAAALRSAGDLLAELPHAELSRPLLALATDPSAHPEMGAVWVASLQGTASAPSSWAIRRLAKHPQAMVAAVREHFEALGSASAPASSVLWALLWLGRVARGSDLIWGKVGFALMSARAYVCCELWLSDYRRRRGVEAWMLLNLSYAALENHRTRAALQAAEHALTLPTDDTLQQHLTFVAFGRAVTGDVARARELFAGRDGTGFGESHAKLFHATGLLLELVAAERHERHVVLKQLGGLDLSRSGLKGADMRSGGTLQRMLAAGVLKQGFVFGFFVMRWLPWLVALALGLGLTFGEKDVAAYCGLALAALPVAYLFWRHSS